MYDVVIVGAGPAGTAAAYDLLESGLKVLILDKYEFPRKKACAGGITPKAYNLFKYDISSQVSRACRSLKLISKYLPDIVVKSQSPLCYMTKREDLDTFSLNKVIEKGARFEVISKIEQISQTAHHVEIKTSDQVYKASFLIGADGSNSTIRRFITNSDVLQKQMALEADVVVDHPEKFKMEFDFSWFKKGYFWIFPKKDCLNVGLYSIDPGFKLSRGYLQELVKRKTGSKTLINIKGYPICTGGFGFNPAQGRVLLVGDAAGMAEKLFGEGIFFAVNSGQQAAQSILISLENKRTASKIYLDRLKTQSLDLKVHDQSSFFLYGLQTLSLCCFSLPFVKHRFAKGYADGKTLRQLYWF